MKSKLDMGARIVLGLIMIVFGLNFFLQFIPMPPPPEKMMKVMTAFMEIGYILPFVKVIEIVAGLMLLANMFTPLALILLAPIILNILCVHTLIDTSGLPMALLLVAIEIFLVCNRWDKFKPLFDCSKCKSK